MAEPMIKLEAGGTAPVLSYNVPEPTSYSGRNFIALEFDRGWFRGGFGPEPGQAATPVGVMRPGLNRDAVVAGLNQLLASGQLTATAEPATSAGGIPILGRGITEATADEIAAISQSGQALTLVRTMSGAVALRALPQLRPRDDDDPPAGGGGSVITLSSGIRRPTAGATLTGPSTGVTVQVAGYATVAYGPGTIKTVEVQVGSEAFKAAKPSIPGNFASWTFSAVIKTSGTHVITARAQHSGGQLSQYRRVSIKVNLLAQQPTGDTEPPDVIIDRPADDATVVLGADGSATIEVAGSASDDSGVSRVDVSVDGGTVKTVPKGPNDWSSWRATASVTGVGGHEIRVRAADTAGNVSQSQLQIMAVTQQPSVPLLQRLLLVEEVRLSSFLGAYGAGRTIKTFSLLPGEKTKISIKTYLRTETDAKRASSILDSFTEESAMDFQTTMESEQSSKNLVEESSHYKVSAEAKAGWGWGSASVSGETSGGTNAAREELSKNISSSTQKHAAKASSKRDVQVNTSFEVKEQEGEETSIEREIENINLSRTLNFVFRQMNQEFISLLHLVDVRVGYFRVDQIPGQPEPVATYREATLPQLDGLIAEVIVPERREEVLDALVHQLEHIFDYQDRLQSLIETKTFVDADGNEIPNAGYRRVRKELVSSYQDPTTPTRIDVPGIILAAVKNVLRTEAVIVDALLGQGEALDDYARRLQDIEVDKREAEAQREVAEADRAHLVNQLVRDNDAKRAGLLSNLTCPCGPQAPALKVAVQTEEKPTEPT